MTTLLAIETSSRLCSVALRVDTTVYTAVESSERQHTRQLLPYITTLLQDAGVTLKQLDAIAFSCGPGSFTGVRLAASVVQGLAFGINLPVIPISTLQTLAQGVVSTTERVLTIMDAHGDQAYWGIYQRDHNQLMQPLEADQRSTPQRVVLPDANNWVAVGDGWARYAEVFTHMFPNITYLPACYPHAKDVLTLADAAYAKGQYVTANQATPVYLYGADHWKKQCRAGTN